MGRGGALAACGRGGTSPRTNWRAIWPLHSRAATVSASSAPCRGWPGERVAAASQPSPGRRAERVEVRARSAGARPAVERFRPGPGAVRPCGAFSTEPEAVHQMHQSPKRPEQGPERLEQNPEHPEQIVGKPDRGSAPFVVAFDRKKFPFHGPAFVS